MASKLMRHEATIITFEPDPTAFAVLQANLVINNVSGVKLYQIALSDREGSIEINKCSPGANKVVASTARLDSILKDEGLNVSRKTLIKIDVEGAAVSVLNGATETLKQKPKIVVELHPGEENVENLLKDYGYAIEKPSNYFL
ncbi:MAG: FkbM family methyltransferase, partial [Thermoproteota archaeon]